MTATAWSAWYPDVMPHVPECPIPIIEHELKRAAQTLMTRSRVWSMFVPVIAVSADDTTVEVVTGDAQADMVRAEEAWYDGAKVSIIPVEEAAKLYGLEWHTATGTPTAIVQMSHAEFRLYPIPTIDATTGLTLRISARPSEASTGIPSDLATRYMDELATGAKSRLMMCPNKPWTNVEMGSALGMAFNSMIDRAISQTAFAGKGRVASSAAWC